MTIKLGSEAEQEPEEELRGGCCMCKDRMGKSIVRGDEAGVAGAQRAKSRRLIRSPGPGTFHPDHERNHFTTWAGYSPFVSPEPVPAILCT